MNEDQIRELLREMRDEPIPAESLARVRGRVAERVAAKGWFRPWRIAAILAPAVCTALLVLWLRTPAPLKTTPPPVITQVETAPVAPIPPLPKPVVRRARAKHRPARPVENVSASGAPVVIRIETPDPTVVILLIGDGD